MSSVWTRVAGPTDEARQETYQALISNGLLGRTSKDGESLLLLVDEKNKNLLGRVYISGCHLVPLESGSSIQALEIPRFSCSACGDPFNESDRLIEHQFTGCQSIRDSGVSIEMEVSRSMLERRLKLSIAETAARYQAGATVSELVAMTGEPRLKIQNRLSWWRTHRDSTLRRDRGRNSTVRSMVSGSPAIPDGPAIHETTHLPPEMSIQEMIDRCGQYDNQLAQLALEMGSIAEQRAALLSKVVGRISSVFQLVRELK